jgi:nucleoid-associated protein YgaU
VFADANVAEHLLCADVVYLFSTTTTATQSALAEAPQATPAIPEPEVVVESQQAVAAGAPALPATPATPANPAARSEAAKANIKEGLRLHQIAGRPTKAQLVLVFGKAGYLLTWPKRTERFGITPETFQSALAREVPAVPLTPVAKTTVEKTKGTA